MERGLLGVVSEKLSDSAKYRPRRLRKAKGLEPVQGLGGGGSSEKDGASVGEKKGEDKD